MQTFEEFAAQVNELAATARQFLADHREDLSGPGADGSRAAMLINQIIPLMPAFEMALLTRSQELAPAPVPNFDGPTAAAGMVTLSGGPHDGAEHFDDGNWALGTLKELGEPGYYYRRTAIDAAEAVDAHV